MLQWLRPARFGAVLERLKSSDPLALWSSVSSADHNESGSTRSKGQIDEDTAPDSSNTNDRAEVPTQDAVARGLRTESLNNTNGDAVPNMRKSLCADRTSHIFFSTNNA